jgi:SAM-dependent methyltransferase
MMTRSPISTYLAKAVGAVALRGPARVLDLACGYGRHTLWLANLGYKVTALDIDRKRLDAVRADLRANSVPMRSVQLVEADACIALPFDAESFDAVIVVHFVAPGLLGHVAAVLKPGGLLVFETFGGQGGNWRSLPLAGELAREARQYFDLIDYLEMPVGPTRTEAVSVKLAGLKRC